MIINQIIAPIANFIRARWKLIIVFSVFLFIVTKIYFFQEKSFRISSAIATLNPPITAGNLRHSIYHPKCMDKWVDSSDFESIEHYVKSKFHDYHDDLFNPTLEGGRRCSSTSEIKFSAPNRESFFGHFPHFSEMYFRFFSLLIWQNRVFELNYESCVHSFQIDMNVRKFWNEITFEKGWNRNIISKINEASGYNTISSNVDELLSLSKSSVITLKNREGYFLHPSDAVLLSSIIRNENPCELAGQSRSLLSHPLKITILNRSLTRKVLNVDNITHVIHEVSQNHSLFSYSHRKGFSTRVPRGISNITVINFDDKPFSHQVKIMHDTDIIISVHGAGLTNLVFMKPCSVVIEAMPWLYNVPSYYTQFSKSSDILHYSWEEGPETSVFNPGLLYNFEIGVCERIMRQYRRYYASGKYTAEELDDMCYFDGGKGTGVCRSCARQVEGLIFSLNKLQETLELAIKDRAKCIRNHPFYNA
jgi:hypothetical protein